MLLNSPKTTRAIHYYNKTLVTSKISVDAKKCRKQPLLSYSTVYIEKNLTRPKSNYTRMPENKLSLARKLRNQVKTINC